MINVLELWPQPRAEGTRLRLAIEDMEQLASLEWDLVARDLEIAVAPDGMSRHGGIRRQFARPSGNGQLTCLP